MPLKAVVDSLDGLEAPIQSLYTKGQDNKFYLGVEGMVPSTRLEEFRTNNIEMKRMLEKFDGIDPEKYRQMTEQEKKIAQQKLIDAGEVDKVVEERIKTLREESENRVKEITTENQNLTSRLSSVLIDSTVKSAAVAAGALPTAVDDVVLRAKGVFTVKNGEVVALDAKGAPVYSKDGVTPLGIDEWVTSLKKSAGHLFEQMRGSGAHGGFGQGGIGDTSKMTATQKIAAGLNNSAG